MTTTTDTTDIDRTTNIGIDYTRRDWALITLHLALALVVPSLGWGIIIAVVRWVVG